MVTRGVTSSILHFFDLGELGLDRIDRGEGRVPGKGFLRILDVFVKASGNFSASDLR